MCPKNRIKCKKKKIRIKKFLYYKLHIINYLMLSLLEKILSLRNLRLSKRDMFSLIIFLYVPIHGIFFQDLKDIRRCG